MSKPVKSSNARKLALNFILLSGGEALSKVFAFVAFVYLAKLLGPDTYGGVEFALAVAMFFSLIVEGGLGILGAREIAKDEQCVLPITFHIVIMRCFLAVGAFLLLVLFAIISNKTTLEKQLLILYGLTIFGTPGLLSWVFQGFDRMKWVAVSTVMRWSLFAGFVFLFIHDPGKVWIVPLIELGAIGCVVAFNFSIFRYFFGCFWRKFDISFCLSLFRQGVPIGLSQVTWGLRAYLPIIMLGLMVGGEVVGWFGVAYRIVVALHTFVWMYFFNIYPSISRCTQQAPDALQQLIGKSIQVNSWAAIFVGAMGTIFAKPMISMIYGPQYAESAIAFQFLIWLVAFILISGHYMYILIAYNKQWFELFGAVCGASAIIVLNLLLIPKYGYIGAAWAILCSEVLTWILNYYFVCRKIAIIHFIPHLIKPLVVGVIMVTVVKLLPFTNIGIMGGSAILLYGLGILVLQPSLINDVRMLVAGNKQESKIV
ncbi:MAG: flippase [Planctomycetes bacterium]|nr:flippase [Planctomycetota bacterium]